MAPEQWSGAALGPAADMWSLAHDQPPEQTAAGEAHQPGGSPYGDGLADRLRAASAPEFGELPGKGSPLVVTSPSSGRAQRQVHRIGAEHVLGVAVREDRFDSAAACA
jgi:hypothetical protein